MSSVGLQPLFSNVTKTCRTARYTKIWWGTRSLHIRQPLPYPIEGGLGKFLPPNALKTVAVDYQEGLLQRLNDELRGSKEEGDTVAQTVLNTAASKNTTLAFNYASLALNNSFFLDCLKPPHSGSNSTSTDHEAELSTELRSTIREQYGGLAQFKATFSAAATGVFTSGWVWFVTSKIGGISIIPTFGPGTLLVRSRNYIAHGQITRLHSLKSRNPSDDVDSLSQRAASYPIAKSPPPGIKPSSPTSGVASKQEPTLPNDGHHPRLVHSTSVHQSSNLQTQNKNTIYDNNSTTHSAPSTSRLLNVGETLHPLFCISLYEHNWISAGYGVWGKEEWLRQFWTVLDWRKASNAYDAFSRNRQSVQ